jgi:hypothetical protein
VKLSLCFKWAQRHGVLREWRYSSTHIFDLGTRCRWVVSFTPRLLYPQGKSPRYPLDRRLYGPQSHSWRGSEEKIPSPHWESNPRTSIVQLVARSNTKSYHRRQLDTTLNQFRPPPAPTPTTYFLTIRLNVILSPCEPSKWPLCKGFPTKILYAFLVSPIQATCTYLLTYLLTYLHTDWLTDWLTNSMELSHSWEANSHSAS